MTAAKTLVLAAALLTGTASHAVTLFTLAGPTAEQATPGTLGYTFTGGAGAATVAFQLDGYRTLDGDNQGFTDTFSLVLNGTTIYSAAFNLGGGGSDTVFLAPFGATQSAVSGGLNLGGVATISVPLTLIAGNNTLDFVYTGSSQGLNDEAWGLTGVLVDGVAAIPEPATWGLMLGGFALAGTALRRRRAIAG